VYRISELDIAVADLKTAYKNLTAALSKPWKIPNSAGSGLTFAAKLGQNL
jgi:hypothetical protein